MTNQDKKLLFTGLAILFGYTKIIRPLFNKLGLTQSDNDILIENEQQMPQSAFNPEFWRNYIYPNGGVPNGRVPLTVEREKRAKTAALAVWYSMGYVSDDEDDAIGAIKSLDSQAMVSLTAWVFQKQYGTDLLSYLKYGKNVLPQNGLSDGELANIIRMVKLKKPI